MQIQHLRFGTQGYAFRRLMRTPSTWFLSFTELSRFIPLMGITQRCVFVTTRRYVLEKMMPWNQLYNSTVRNGSTFLRTQLPSLIPGIDHNGIRTLLKYSTQINQSNTTL